MRDLGGGGRCQSHRQFVRQKWRWLADKLKHREWERRSPTVAKIQMAAELSALLDEWCVSGAHLNRDS